MVKLVSLHVILLKVAEPIKTTLNEDLLCAPLKECLHCAISLIKVLNSLKKVRKFNNF